MAVPGSLGLAMKELDAAEEPTREVAKGFKPIPGIAHLILHSFDFHQFFISLPCLPIPSSFIFFRLFMKSRL